MTARVKRRRLRVVVPFMVLIALVSTTLIVHATQQPDPADSDFLSPVSSAGIGSGVLAGRLGERGVTVDRQTGLTAALTELWRGGDPATLFVTTPDLADLDRLSRPGAIPPLTRVVVVAPSEESLVTSAWPLHVLGTRWTTGVAAPGCADPVASTAGPAAVNWRRYTPDTGASCYGDALLTVAAGGVAVTVVGSPDPFRNDRIAEHGNAALAVGLLAQTSRVVWLDLHQREVTLEPSPSPSSTRPEPESSSSAPDARPRPTGAPQQTPGDPAAPPPVAQPDEPNPLTEAFPAAFWATLLLVALALLALAAAAARRLGTPVAEPLLSRVPSNETMLGHARLYQRGRARGASLDLLRGAARRRLAAHLGLPVGATLARIAEQSGLEEDDVREVLAGVHPDNDSELIEAALAVQQLERDITSPDEGVQQP
ncbi:DUF4350 domain-containing protein [Actinoplanes awajinensis]|uniref:DUF4350 domain-containing protein n=1 Tax=Actinoplanes awajinensis subsp. mycoplanecinus TaxID=135947 RepID=A0A101JQ97_9ACTN|nr:DUF4350 domain-containing protein [Actinoplanes awajinensis]KUL30968.1 hypothetical protein ADL15_23765 [Actinoplanes awajinensis subsp. mycoplanecinus]